MKKVLSLFIMFLLFGCYSYGPRIDNRNYLSIEYGKYKIDTHFKVNNYKIESYNNEYVIKARTSENHDLEIKLKKDFNGYIEVYENVDLKHYYYSYYVKSNENHIVEAKMMSSDDIDLSYSIVKGYSRCKFNGYLDLKTKDNVDDSYLNYDFYFIEDGTRRSDINEEIYLNIKRI